MADTLVFDELTGLPPAPTLEDVDLGKRPTLEEARLSKLLSAYELAKRSGVMTCVYNCRPIGDPKP